MTKESRGRGNGRGRDARWNGNGNGNGTGDSEQATGGWSTYAQSWGRDVSEDETVIEHQFERNAPRDQQYGTGYGAPRRAPAALRTPPPAQHARPTTPLQPREPREPRETHPDHRDERKTPLLAFLRFEAGGIHEESGQRIVDAQNIHLETPMLYPTICQAPRCAIRHGAVQTRVRADMSGVLMWLCYRGTEERAMAPVMRLACSGACVDGLRLSWIRQYVGSGVSPRTDVIRPDFSGQRCQAPSCSQQNGGVVVELPVAHMFTVWRDLAVFGHVAPQRRHACSLLCATEIQTGWVEGWLN